MLLDTVKKIENREEVIKQVKHKLQHYKDKDLARQTSSLSFT